MSLDGENVGVVSLQPDITCSLRFFRATSVEQDGESHVRRSSPRIFKSTSDAAGYDASVMMWTSLQEVHEKESISLLGRSVVMHTAHSSFPQGVCIGLSTIQLHILHFKSERETVFDGKKRARERGLPAFIDGGDLRKMLFATD